MSGGHLNYFYSDLEEHVGDFGDRELDDLVKDLSELFHAREWFLSADTNEGTWVEARDAFKKKWFSKASRGDRIETYLDQIKEDVMKSLGLSDKYCKNCKHWSKENEDLSAYGVCENVHSCLMHRSETCDKFERAEKK